MSSSGTVCRLINGCRIALCLSASLLCLSALPIRADSTTVPVSDSNIVKGLSPLNWVRTAEYISASVGNASLKVGFSGTSRVVLNVDTKVITTGVATRYPIISWSVNNGPPQTHQLVKDESAIVIAANTANPLIDLYCKSFSPFENRYIGDVPENSVKITGFTIDVGGVTTAAMLPSKIWLNIGNSIESGDGALYAANQGVPAADLWASSNEARASYGYLLATHYNYREIRISYGGYNWSGGLANLPRLSTVIDNITSTTSRLTNGVLNPCPDVVLINLGENGVPAQNDVTDALTKLRNLVAATTKIIVMVPVSGKARSEVTAAFNVYKSSSNDSRAYLVDLGNITFATCDGCHPTAEGHRTIYAAATPHIDKIVLSDNVAVSSSPFNLANAMEPFWSSATMYDESVLMTSLDGSLPQAALLFTPTSIVSVKDATLQKEFLPGVDFTFEGGLLKLLPGSTAPYLTGSQLYPAFADNRTMPKSGGGYVLWSEGHYIQGYQLAVTYKHGQGGWSGPVPRYQSDSLPVVTGKLKNGSPMKIVYFGDSILEGFNASGYLSQDATLVSPFMPSWAQLVTDNLRRYYTAPLSARNAAVAGQTSTWGAQNVHALVTVENPDLVVIAFGMNDGGGNLAPASFKANVQAIIADVKSQNPAAEFILVSPTLPNPEGFAGRQTEYVAVLRELTGIGVVLADMTGVHQELLKRKAFRDMTGNNINHPNDFLIRWYAQQVAGILIPPDQLPSATRRNVALASFGGLASASSTISNNFHAATVNNGDRRGYDWDVGRNGGGWNDATANAYPDWVQIQFPTSQTIEEIDVFTVQDAYQTPGEPTPEMTFTQHGITDFAVQYWTGASWNTIPNGSVSGNTKVWRQFTFAPLTTDKIRVLVNAALNTYSRIIEIEAYASVSTANLNPASGARLAPSRPALRLTTRRHPNHITITLSGTAAASGRRSPQSLVAIYDAHGRRLPDVRLLSSTPDAVMYTWKTDHTPSGVYFVKATRGSQVLTRAVSVIGRKR